MTQEFVPSPDVYGYTLFCDDIRYEVGGKITYVGAYSQTLNILGNFPATLAKLALAVSVIRKPEVFLPKFTLQIFMPGDPADAPSNNMEVEEEVKGATSEQLEAICSMPEQGQLLIKMDFHLVVAPMKIKEPGLIKVQANVREKLVRLGSLRVVQATAGNNASADNQV